MMNLIKRHLLKDILSAVENFPAIAILGARQTGKTTLSKMLVPEIRKNCLYVDLENPRDKAMLANPLSFFEANEEKCIILDEIQRMPELFPVLRSVIDKKREASRFILLGSASTDLLFMSSETLAGRIVYFELSPFVYSEIKDVIGLNRHWVYGGFPQIVLNDDPGFRENWYRSFLLTYVERDFRIMGLDADANSLYRFFSMLAHLTGNVLNKSNLAKSMGLSHARISEYLNYFEQAFLIRLLPSWSSNLKKRLVKSPKLYIRDSGLLHYLHRIRNYNELLGHPVLGNSWESYVMEQIISTYRDKYNYYYYRTQDGTECDLLVADGIKLVTSIEIKFTDTPKTTKSFTTAINDLQTGTNYIIVPENKLLYNLNERIKVCDPDQFFDDFTG